MGRRRGNSRRPSRAVSRQAASNAGRANASESGECTITRCRVKRSSLSPGNESWRYPASFDHGVIREPFTCGFSRSGISSMPRASCALSAGCKYEARMAPPLAANRTAPDIRGIPAQKYEREPIHSYIARVLGQRKHRGLSRGCGAAPRKPRGGGCGSVVARHGING